MLKVQATHMGYYDHKKRPEGDIFIMREEDYYKMDPKTKKKITKVDEDGDEVYVTASWVNVLEENYDPANDAPKVEKRGLIKKASVQPIAPVDPKSSNPKGFAPTPAPAKPGPVSAAQKQNPNGDGDKPLPGSPTYATHSSKGDDVI